MNLTERYQKIESVTKYSNYYLGKFYTWLATPTTELAARLGLHPNHMTLISLVLGLAACWFFAQGTRAELYIGAVILYISYVLDWCDGQLARFTGKMSPFGGWLDQMCDRVKEFAYVTTLAYGYWNVAGDAFVFVWAMAALFFLYLLEYYGQMNRAIPTKAAAAQSPAAPQMGKPQAGRRKWVIDFSIDEQYFFLVLAVVFFGAKVTLIGLVLISALFAVYKPLKAWRGYFQEEKRRAA